MFEIKGVTKKSAIRKLLQILLLTTGLLVSGNCAAGIKDSIHAYIVLVGIQHPDIVLKQAILETGWFQSKMLMDKNNLFGFRASKKYMRFDSWQACIDYYKTWQDKNYTNPEENYYAFLKRMRYARTKDYIRVLKHIKIDRAGGAPLPPHKPHTQQPAPTKKPPK
ncbi:MAG: hypothetical protein RLZZ367_1869 [Bacteroidota bacterium]